MKLLIASDIHGNLENTIKLLDKFKNHNADKLIILGDIYHGYSYSDSREMANLFSEYCNRLILIKGNCDSTYDLNYSPVGLLNEYIVEFKNRHIYFNHGHMGYPHVNFNVGDIYCHGHTHINDIGNYNGVIICNPGSISLPRGGSVASYMIIDEDGIHIYNFKDVIIKELLFEVFNEK